MSTFEILSLIIGVVALFGGCFAAFISLKVDITKLQTEVTYIKEKLDDIIPKN